MRAARHIALALAAGLSGAALLGAGPAATQASPPATLIADEIVFSQTSQAITATGNVEVFWRGTRLTARAIRYSADGDLITVEGPLRLTDADGRVTIVADFAELTTDMREGVITSARMVLDQQMQIAASRIDRTEGRYTQLYQAVASSCEVCAEDGTPLWEIRARRVIHDAEERQLYFDHAQFRVVGIPVFYLPRMRLPDPTLDRATGFLTPTLRFSDRLGTRLRVPYFVTLGDHADVLIAPWIGLEDSQTVELRYRQAFRDGFVQVTGAVSEDDLTDDDLRGYVIAQGNFNLPRGYTLSFGIEEISDPAYRSDYGFGIPILLEDYLRVDRVSAATVVELGVTNYTSLRAGDDNALLPTRTARGEILHRFEPPVLGGIATVGVDAFAYQRPSSLVGVDAAGNPTGTDVTRLSGSLEWRRSDVLPGGVLLATEIGLFADAFEVAEDADFDGSATRLTPAAAVELRWPLLRTDPGGATHLIEPIVQIAWSDASGAEDVPNEDSLFVEFDEANLFAFNRFPGADRREEGARANLGIGYTRDDPLGWSAGVLAGMVLRNEDHGQFTAGSGLDGVHSDLLVAAHVELNDRLRLINRAVFDTDFAFNSNELALWWLGDAHAVFGTYTWLEADDGERRPRDLREVAINASYRFTDNWDAGVNWRYDLTDELSTSTQLTLGYENECVDVDFSLSRAEYTSDNVTTEFGVTVELNGFGATRDGRSHARTCRN